MYATPDSLIELNPLNSSDSTIFYIEKQLNYKEFEPITLPNGTDFITVYSRESGVEIEASTLGADHVSQISLGYNPQTSSFEPIPEEEYQKIQSEEDCDHEDSCFIKAIKGQVKGECMAFGCKIEVEGNLFGKGQQSNSEGITLRITRSNLN